MYCGFYSTTSLSLQRRYVEALCREYELRRNSMPCPPTTIYIGGGTPSCLPLPYLEHLFSVLGSASEVTMECNPDDVTEGFAQSLRQLAVNRVSMGAQTFCDERLRFIGRRHTAAQVSVAVERLRHAGIGNISIDLMYGFPDETLDDWQRDIKAALALHVEHLSAYALTYEEHTPLYKLWEQGRVKPVDEELCRDMYYTLIDRLTAADYEHYEISNFARSGYRSRHNSAYWNHTPYLGLGAAAHSFDGHRRQWNVADIMQYMEGVESGEMVTDSELLDGDTLYNDLVMTALRTYDGLSLEHLDNLQSSISNLQSSVPNPQFSKYRHYCLDQAQRYIDGGLLVHERETDRLRLTRDGLFVSDMVMADLMLVK